MTPARFRFRPVLLLLLAASLAGPAVGQPAAAADAPYRIRGFELADICPEGLPWTADRPLRLPARRPRDADGVPMIVVDGKRYYWPGALAINGMKRVDAFRDRGDPRQLVQALKQARRLRLLALDRRRAAWLPFWYDYRPAGQRAPWFNAMSQGLVLSFFVRLHRVTGAAIHLDAAEEVFRSFLRLGRAHRPWVAHVDERRFLWLEHYPRRRPDHVLNAHLHALFGIYEYWQLTRSVPARRVLLGAVATMRRNAGRYRQPGGLSLYGLRSRTRHGKYHEIHVWQLHLLGKVSGDPWFDRLAHRFAEDRRPVGHVNGRPARHGPAVVGPHCRPNGNASPVDPT